MKKYIIPTFLLIISCVMTYNYTGFGLLLVMLILLCSAFLVVVGLFRIFRRIHRKWYQVPIMIIFISFLGIGLGILRPYEPAIIDSGNASEKLSYAYKSDQKDRMNLKSFLGPFKKELQQRDSMRLKQVQHLINSKQVGAPLDKFHAAFIFHHSKGSEHFEQAHQLATEAAAASELQEHYQAQWLAKASYDRWMLSLGKPEKYHTQDHLSIKIY